jgi:NitT/TauT family transport system substrate-binding protein
MVRNGIGLRRVSRLGGGRLRRLRKVGVVGCAAAGVAIAAAGCGGGGTGANASSGGGGSKTKVTKITLGVLPLVDEATSYVARSQGYFTKHHLEVTLKPMSSGSASVPQVLNGQVQFASSSVLAPVIAVSKGLPLKVVAPQSDAGATPATDSQSLVVAPNGPKTIKELEGKTIGVGSLQNPGEFAARAYLEEQGIDYSKIHVVEIEEPDMVSALKSGRVAGAVVSEPFQTVALEAGLRELIKGVFASGKLASSAKNIYYTSSSYLSQNPEVATEFSEAVVEANEYINKNPEAARQAVKGFTEIPAKVLSKIVLPQYATSIDCTSVTSIIGLEKKWGWIKKNVSLSELLWSQAPSTGSCQ